MDRVWLVHVRIIYKTNDLIIARCTTRSRIVKGLFTRTMKSVSSDIVRDKFCLVRYCTRQILSHETKNRILHQLGLILSDAICDIAYHLASWSSKSVGQCKYHLTQAVTHCNRTTLVSVLILSSDSTGYFVWPAGANPTIASYNAKDSLEHFENKIIFFYFEKRSSLLQRWRCSC
jgi:hypothetical protein